MRPFAVRYQPKFLRRKIMTMLAINVNEPIFSRSLIIRSLFDFLFIPKTVSNKPKMFIAGKNAINSIMKNRVIFLANISFGKGKMLNKVNTAVAITLTKI